MIFGLLQQKIELHTFVQFVDVQSGFATSSRSSRASGMVDGLGAAGSEIEEELECMLSV